jgi:integrase
MYLAFLYEREYTLFHLSLVIDKNFSEDSFFVEEFDEKWQRLFKPFISENKLLLINNLKVFEKASEVGFTFFKNQRYSTLILNAFEHIVLEFKILMEANNLLFSKELVDTWFDYNCCCGIYQRTSYRGKRRILYLIELISRGEKPVLLPIIITNKIKKYEIPIWSNYLLDQYLQEKIVNGLQKSSIYRHNYACRLFLSYLEKIKLKSIDSLTPQIIKNFQSQYRPSVINFNSTYSSEIRSFLEFLGRKNYIPPSFSLSISCKSAPKENIVHILSNKQLTTIEKYKSTTGPKVIIDMAIVLLGLKMGLRKIDVINLEINAISFEKEMISFVQQKTGKFISLPLPTDVGNYLFKYLKDIRPESKEPYVFIGNHVPYSKVSAGTCNNALKRAIQASNEKASFHCLRRTYATKLSLAHIPSSIIVEALGHSNESTLNKYLLLDSERMRKCAISLNEIEYTGGLL